MTGIHQTILGGARVYNLPEIVTISDLAQNNADFCTHALPATDSGDLLMAFVAIPSSGPINNPSSPTGMTAMFNDTLSTTLHFRGWYLVCDGTESGNFVCDLTGSAIDCESVLILVRSRQGNPEDATTSATGTSAPNPATIAPSWGTSNASLIITLTAYNEAIATTTVSAYPANYLLSQNNFGGASVSISMGMAARRLLTASEDPGAFTLSGAEDTITATVAVRSSV